ncbi:MAG: formylglycine-generating enzyme required for sulfatase activity/cytochrome c5 [Verrucomicrobiales bacterium]
MSFTPRGAYGEGGLQPFDMEKALREDADYVVFNGSVGAMTGDNAPTAKVGENVRLFVGNGGPNLVSSFHVIGEIFDKVYVEGGSYVNENVQSTMVPAGGSAIVEFKLDVPGTYILVDHSIFRAFNKGAIAMIKAEGADAEMLYSGKTDDRIYQPEGGAIQTILQESRPQALAQNKEERINYGLTVYSQVCIACHQAQGQGIPKAFPPVAKSDYLNADTDRAISTVLHGLAGKVTVNGEVYESIMPQLGLSDEAVANALTYVYNNWENNGTEVTPEMVAAVRKAGAPATPPPQPTNFAPMLKLIAILLSFSVTLSADEPPSGMVLIPAGSFTPLYIKDAKQRSVKSFLIDVAPVTNAEFLEFVRAHPKWRRSQVKRLFVDGAYLKHWAGDLNMGPQTDKIAASPVTNISWFAARAYLKSKEKRLPTEDEWELVACADETRTDASKDPAFTRRLLEWYGRSSSPFLPSVKLATPNVYGIVALHGYTWEWVRDFNNAMVTGKSRADSGIERSLFCAGGALGTADPHNYAAFMRYAFRSSLKGNYAVANLGFRGARSIKINQTP